MMQIRYPNITGRTPDERQAQMERFIRSMVDQLNMQKTSSEPVQTQENTAPVTQPKIDFSKLFASHIADYWKTIYPVGSIYLSVSATNPATLFGGKWEQIKDTFLLAAGSSYSAGSTGGEATHTLSVNEMPSHNHAPSTHDVAGSESGYKRYFTTNLQTGSDSVARVRVAAGTSTDRYAMAATTSGDISEAATTANTGGSKSHNNMPPYLAVYVWKRTE